MYNKIILTIHNHITGEIKEVNSTIKKNDLKYVLEELVEELDLKD